MADFLAGRREESSPEEILMVIHRLVPPLPQEFQEGIAGNGGRELEAPGNIKVKRIKLGSRFTDG